MVARLHGVVQDAPGNYGCRGSYVSSLWPRSPAIPEVTTLVLPFLARARVVPESTGGSMFECGEPVILTHVRAHMIHTCVYMRRGLVLPFSFGIRWC